MFCSKNFKLKDLIKERHYTSECLVINEERISYISSRLKRKKISFKIKVWDNVCAREESYKIKSIDPNLNLKKTIEYVINEYKAVFENGGCVEIVTDKQEWCVFHIEHAGTFLCSRILEKLNIKIQEVEEDAKLSDEVPLWIDNFLTSMNQ